MSDEDVLKQAKKLGETIGNSEVWIDFKKAREVFKGDEVVQKLLTELREREKKQAEKIEKGQPIEVYEKKEIQELEEQLSLNKNFMEFLNYEKRYLILMTDIEKAIKEGTDGEISEKREKEDSGKTEEKLNQKKKSPGTEEVNPVK